MKNKTRKNNKIWNILLLLSFVVTIMAPVTGVHIHKMASLIFLLLCFVHTFLCRREMNWKRTILFIANVIAFISGIFGLILDQYPIISNIHTAVSIGCVFFFAIHIFVYHKKIVVMEVVQYDDK